VRRRVSECAGFCAVEVRLSPSRDFFDFLFCGSGTPICGGGRRPSAARVVCDSRGRHSTTRSGRALFRPVPACASGPSRQNRIRAAPHWFRRRLGQWWATCSRLVCGAPPRHCTPACTPRASDGGGRTQSRGKQKLHHMLDAWSTTRQGLARTYVPYFASLCGATDRTLSCHAAHCGLAPAAAAQRE